jgi:hypothetical protein
MKYGGEMSSTKDDLCVGCFDNVQGIGSTDAGLIYPYLLNDSNKNLAVDGSLSPVIFSYQPPGGFEYYLNAISIYMDEGGSFTGEGFASETAPLTNGIDILVNNNLLFNFKANKDLETWFTYQNPLVGSVAAPPTRLIGIHNILMASNGLPARIGIDGVKAVVRDDIEITNLNIHVMLMGYLRIPEDDNA